MKLRVSFKGIKHSMKVDEKVRKKSFKLEKYFLGAPIDLSWTFQEAGGQIHCELKFVGPTFQYHASSESHDILRTVEDAAYKLEKQIKRKKDAWKKLKQLSIDVITSLPLDHHQKHSEKEDRSA